MVWTDKNAQTIQLLRKITKLIEPHELLIRGPMNYTDAATLQATLKNARELLHALKA